tara:strand:+ start:364 stop:624 length:261 start_codon:yes stop_codon:yes gene_type:complete
MEKIIFLGLAIPIMAFVFYLGATAIMKGFKVKEDFKSEKKKENENLNLSNEDNKLSDEINKLNELHLSGVLTKEEFEKAKKRLLDG